MTISEASPAPATFLQQTSISVSAGLFREYARYLLRTSNAYALPVQLDLIRNRHGFQRHIVSIPQRGFLLGDIIFIKGDDTLSVQRFTEAHEMMESLVTALNSEMLSRIDIYGREKFKNEKELWCEQGAAELLMPEELFFPMAEQQGITFAAARRLAGHCQTSLTATIRRMLDADVAPCIFAILREGHRKAQYVPSKTGQGVLWGDTRDWDPPKELRVWKRWSSSQVNAFVCLNESFSRNGLAYSLLRSEKVGVVVEDYETLDLENIKGSYFVEAMLVAIENTPSIMTLIHL